MAEVDMSIVDDAAVVKSALAATHFADPEFGSGDGPDAEMPAAIRRLSLLGLNHRTAMLELRERMAFDREQSAAAVAAFRDDFPGCEMVLLSTCNRMEIYSARPNDGQLASESAWSEKMAQWLADRGHALGEMPDSRHYRMNGALVVEHLFAVAASLDSMVLGETQILGQVKDAYEMARRIGAVRGVLHPLFQRAAAVGKQVFSETSLGEGAGSIAQVAVDCARRILGSLRDKTVLCVGAGKMSSLVVQSLADLRAENLLVCNRDFTKARDLASRFQGQAVDFARLADQLASADIVISGTGSAKALITRQMVKEAMRRRSRPLLLVDIAMPRDIEASVRDLAGCHLYDLDDLQRIASSSDGRQRRSLAAAQAIVEEHSRQFVVAQRVREMGPAIDNLYRRCHALAQAELARTLSEFSGLEPDEKARLQESVRLRVNRVLHDRIRTLRKHKARDDSRAVQFNGSDFALAA